jgi:hypothetical protein
MMGTMARSTQQPSMKLAHVLVEKMGTMGYFGSSSYRTWQPQPLERLFEQEGWVLAPIELLTKSGLVRFEYTKDPSVHPKDVLDQWRLVLLPPGATVLRDAGTEVDPALVDEA